MTDMEILIGLLVHCGPWVAGVAAGTAVFNRLYERVEFARYERRRRAYSEWRLKQVKSGRM